MRTRSGFTSLCTSFICLTTLKTPCTVPKPLVVNSFRLNAGVHLILRYYVMYHRLAVASPLCTLD